MGGSEPLAIMDAAPVASDLSPARCRPAAPLMAHQVRIKQLLRPGGQIHRLLVDHPTGAGKTRTMIAVLDTFYATPRAKLVVVPIGVFSTQSVCRNFYKELLRWPNRYRDYFACLRPADACRASGMLDGNGAKQLEWDFAGLPEMEVRRLCASLREALSMKGAIRKGGVKHGFVEAFAQSHPTLQPPAAPLRACSYSAAARFYGALDEDDGPLASMMKFGYDASSCGNPYQNKVVLLDEVHNILRASSPMVELQELLGSAPGSVIVGFSGTPFGSDAGDPMKLLQLFGGCLATLDRQVIESAGLDPATDPSIRDVPANEGAWLQKVSLGGAILNN
jgi:hypothetical protein